MKIINVLNERKCIRIIFDNDQRLLVHSLLIEESIYKGKSITDKQYEELVYLASITRPFTDILHFVNRGAYSAEFIYKRLQKSVKKIDDIRFIITKLKELNYINDRLHAVTYYEDVSDIRMYGYELVKRNLAHMLYPSKVIESIEFNEEFERSKAINYIKKISKKLDKIPNERKKDKAIKQLIARGFYPELSTEVVNEFLLMNNPEKEFALLVEKYRAGIKKYSATMEYKDAKTKVCALLLREGYYYFDILKVIKLEEEKNAN